MLMVVMMVVVVVIMMMIMDEDDDDDNDGENDGDDYDDDNDDDGVGIGGGAGEIEEDSINMEWNTEKNLSRGFSHCMKAPHGAYCSIMHSILYVTIKQAPKDTIYAEKVI